jgi:hypothetical protein
MDQDKTSAPSSNPPPSASRATFKQRLGAAVYLSGFALGGWNGWVELHSGFAIFRTIGWAMIVASALFAPRFAWVVLTGRMSRTMRHNLDPANYRMTFSEWVSRTRREIEEERNRSHKM